METKTTFDNMILRDSVSILLCMRSNDGWIVRLRSAISDRAQEFLIPFDTEYPTLPPSTSEALIGMLEYSNEWVGAECFDDWAEEGGRIPDSFTALREYISRGDVYKKLRALLGDKYEEYSSFEH